MSLLPALVMDVRGTLCGMSGPSRSRRQSGRYPLKLNGARAGCLRLKESVWWINELEFSFRWREELWLPGQCLRESGLLGVGYRPTAVLRRQVHPKAMGQKLKMGGTTSQRSKPANRPGTEPV